MGLDWHWRPDGRVPAGAPSTEQRFPSQGEAESWLGEIYPDLITAGIRAVSLYEGDRLVYGPMSLEADAG